MPPGNARWIALSAGAFVLSVAIAVAVGTLGLFGFAPAGATSGRVVPATVIAATPCDRAGAMETVRFQVDDRERAAALDACGHRADEPVEVRITSDSAGVIVHTARAAVGDSGSGRRFGLVLLAVAGIAGAGYGLLVRRGPRGRARLPRRR